MGAGRKTFTYDVDARSTEPYMTFEDRQRNLGPDSLGGVIFGCSNETKEECLQGLVFGLPRAHMCYVGNITPGLPIFLFNYDDRKMHGIFRAVTEGQLEINPYAWTGAKGPRKTAYPAQVKVEVYKLCPPLAESDFKPAIKECYSSDARLNFELKKSEAAALCRLFDRGHASRQMQTAPAPQSVPRPPAQVAARPADHAAARQAPATPAAAPAVAPGPPPAPKDPDGWQEVSSKKKFVPAVAPAQNAWASKASSSAAVPPAAPVQPSPAAAPSMYSNSAPAPAAYPTQQNEYTSQNGHASPSLPAATTPPPVAYQVASSPVVTTGGLDADSAAAAVTSELAGLGLAPGVALVVARHLGHLQAGQALLAAEWAGVRNLLDEAAAAGGILQHVHTLQAENTALQQSQSVLQSQVAQLRRDMALLVQRMVSGAPASATLPAAGAAYAASDGPPVGAVMGSASTAPAFEAAGGQELFLAGGNDGVAWLSSVEVFSPSTGAWQQRAAMPSARGYGAAAALGRSLYIMGGGDGASWLSSVVHCDLDTGTWREVAPMSDVRGSLAGVPLDGKIYVMGGGQPQVNLDTTEIYDPNIDAWMTGKRMSTRRFTTAAAVLEGTVVVAGGYDGTSYLRSAERLDPREGRWTPVAEMLSKRGSHALTVAGGMLFAVGGWDSQAFLSSVEVYDARAGAWRLVAPMTTSRAYGAAVTVDGTVYAVGGMRNAQHNETVERYDRSANAWTPVALPAGAASFKRAFLASCVLDPN